MVLRRSKVTQGHRQWHNLTDYILWVFYSDYGRIIQLYSPYRHEYRWTWSKYSTFISEETAIRPTFPLGYFPLQFFDTVVISATMCCNVSILITVIQTHAYFGYMFFGYTLRLKNVPPLTCYNLYTHGSIATIFPHHLTIASAVPGKTENPEIASFHLNAACLFTKKHESSHRYH